MTADLKPVLDGLKPLSRLDSPREMIRQFTPNWFAATMGTGILALALPQVPGVGVVFEPAEGEKCQRCWKILPDVGTHAHPGTCARCDAVLG